MRERERERLDAYTVCVCVCVCLSCGLLFLAFFSTTRELSSIGGRNNREGGIEWKEGRKEIIDK
jgi:hypothetical protein